VSRAVLVLALVAGACAAPKSAVQAPPPESPAARYLRDPAAVNRGKRIFIGTCGAYCHSTHNVERDAPSLFDCEWKDGGSDEAIFKSISEGVPGTRMPAWKGALPQGDDDIWRVVAYLRSASTCTKQAP
jgi:mono/diheme cytochrome c family protein